MATDAVDDVDVVVEMLAVLQLSNRSKPTWTDAGHTHTSAAVSFPKTSKV